MRTYVYSKYEEVYSTCNQDRQIQALRDWYDVEPENRLRICDAEEIFAPREKTRVKGPFDSEVLYWIVRMRTTYPEFPITIGRDADGKSYVEF